MDNSVTAIARAISLMREAQAVLDNAGCAVAAAYLETALGFAEAEVAGLEDTGVAQAN